MQQESTRNPERHRNVSECVFKSEIVLKNKTSCSQMSQSIVLLSLRLLLLSGDSAYSPANHLQFVPIITSVLLGFALFSLLARDSEADNANSRCGLGPMITSCRWISGTDSHLAALINADSICDRSPRQTHLCFIVFLFIFLYIRNPCRALGGACHYTLQLRSESRPPET